MKKNIKLGFYQKILLAITDFRFYPYILKSEKLSRSFAHFALFIIMLSFLITIKYSNVFFQRIDSFIAEYHDNVPEFLMEDGRLQVSKTGSAELSNGIYAVVDTSMNYSEYVHSSEYQKLTKYDERLFINSDKITYENTEGDTAEFLFSNVKESYNKDSVYQLLLEIYNDNTLKIIAFLLLFISLMIGYLFVKAIEVVFLALITSIAANIYRMKIDFKSCLKIAIYCITLPYIVELISIIVIGGIKDYAVLASNILAYVYIFYAIRAVKLDAFLLIFTQKDSTKIVKKENDEKEEKSEDDKDGGNNA